MARVDLRASRKTTPTIFKKHHHPQRKNMHNAIKRRNQASIFDTLALTSFHTFSLSLRHGKFLPKAHVLRRARLSARRQDRRWLVEVIIKQKDPMSPSEQERLSFIALTMLPTDQALYEVLTAEKLFKNVKMLYARLLRERNRARNDQGIKYHQDAVTDWLVVQMMEKMAKKGKKGKKVTEQGEREAYRKVDGEMLGMSMPGVKGKGGEIFDMDMPFRGPRV